MEHIQVIGTTVKNLKCLKNNKMSRTKKELITYDETGVKQYLRQYKANIVKDICRIDPCTKLLDLYGDGKSFNYYKEHTKAQILSIDDNPQIGKRMKGIPGTRAISIKDLCLEGIAKFSVLDMDFCGYLGLDMKENLSLLPKIMTDSGTLFITVRNGREPRFNKGTARSTNEIAIHADLFFIFMNNLIKLTRIKAIQYSSGVKTNGGRKAQNMTSMKVYHFKWEKVESKTDFHLTPEELYLDKIQEDELIVN